MNVSFCPFYSLGHKELLVETIVSWKSSCCSDELLSLSRLDVTCCINCSSTVDQYKKVSRNDEEFSD